MKTKLINITPDAERHIVEVARVSSSRKDKREDYVGLIRYLIKHGHWSPFEHAYATFEIETSKAIGIQLIRHRSFTFQELSQRYQDVTKVTNDMFEPVELRRQATDNRQSSSDIFDEVFKVEGGYTTFDDMIRDHLNNSEALYREMLKAGVARETARMILPMCTKTTIHMTGSVRSWIHFLAIRDDEHAQKEMQQLAKHIRAELAYQLPTIMTAVYG